ncbi:PspC domain-containing protein [Anditalea andensis]|uniref:Phage shock protein PspC N-terminal domain-containing protein n=1 Tax=Anditalea andensis TaxID=1048983 RepID=A0A074KUM1_9BACT|nr:PspC domain-containing protein [Anditalea andensis]KEO73656.1 hypothetical protein EL17_12215 [Anditalea andensis]
MNKKLTRSSRNKMVAGVCGGLANYFGISPNKMRLIYVLISIFSAAFPGLLVYVILWIFLPEDHLYL